MLGHFYKANDSEDKVECKNIKKTFSFETKLEKLEKKIMFCTEKSIQLWNNYVLGDLLIQLCMHPKFKN